MTFEATTKEIQNLKLRPTLAIDWTDRKQDKWLTDERFAIKRVAVVNDKPVKPLLDNSGEAKAQDNMLDALLEQFNKVSMVPLYVNPTVLERKHEYAIKDERRLIEVESSSAYKNRTLINADKYLLLKRACEVKGVELHLWQEAGKSNAPIAISRGSDATFIGLLMPVMEEYNAKKANRDFKQYHKAMKDAQGETDWYGQSDVSELKRAPYRNKEGQMVFPIEMIESAVFSGDHLGYCLQCAGERDACEPDAAKYECYECGTRNVYGAENIVIMGLTF